MLPVKKLCFGCMRMKQAEPVCEYCGFDERIENQSHQLPIGTILQNQYLVGRVLGQGGFGITYMGWDQHLSVPVAIKEYFPGGVVHRNTLLGTHITCDNGTAPEQFEKHKSKFLKEARTLAQLSGIPEVVQIKSFFPENGTAYIVMEYVEGITLKDHLKRLGRPMTEAEALAIMEPVLEALQKVHDHGLIHRDISPDNIMLPQNGGIKLIDFGTVRYMDDSGKSKSTEAVLKPGFAPMEQYNTRGNLGTWTDVYAICATFHYLLTGKVPADVHDRLDEGESLTLLRNKAGISRKLISALENGMKIRYQDRVQTIGELCQLLYSAAKTSPVKKQAKGKYAKQPEKIKAAPKKRKSGLLAVCALVAVAIATAAILLIPQEQESQLQLAVSETSAAPTHSTTVPETTSLETTLSPEEIAYQEAAALEANGETAKAAIAFGKLGDYADARERSLQQWHSLRKRRTIAQANSDLYEKVFLGIKENGTVVAQGVNRNGECSVDDWSNIIEVYTNGYISFGLRKDGTIAMSDVTEYLQTDKGFIFDARKKITTIQTWTRMEHLYVTEEWDREIWGLTIDGKVYYAGYPETKPYLPEISNWTDIVEFYDCNRGTEYDAVNDNLILLENYLGLRMDGTVVHAGEDEGLKRAVESWHDIVKIKQVSIGFVVGWKSNGTMVSYGGPSALTQEELSDTVDIVAGYALLKRDGTIAIYSDSDPTFTEAENWRDIESIYYYFHLMGVTSDGTVLTERGTEYQKLSPKSGEWTDIVDMVVKDICFGLKKDGTVCVSENRYVYGLKPWAGIRLPGYEKVIPPNTIDLIS